MLPGGMTRVAKLDDRSVSMQRGGSSLDTWVLTDGPVDSFSMLPSLLSVGDLAPRRPPSLWGRPLWPPSVLPRAVHARSAARVAARLFAESPKAFRRRLEALWDAQGE